MRMVHLYSLLATLTVSWSAHSIEMLPNCYKRAGLSLPPAHSVVMLVDQNSGIDYAARKMAQKLIKEVKPNEMFVLASYRQSQIQMSMLGVMPDPSSEHLESLSFPKDYMKSAYSRCVKRSAFDLPSMIRNAMSTAMPFDSRAVTSDDHLKVLTTLLTQYVPDAGKGVTLYWFSNSTMNAQEYKKIAAQLEYPEQVINSIKASGMDVPKLAPNSNVILLTKSSYGSSDRAATWKSYFDAIRVKFEERAY